MDNLKKQLDHRPDRAELVERMSFQFRLCLFLFLPHRYVRDGQCSVFFPYVLDQLSALVICDPVTFLTIFTVYIGNILPDTNAAPALIAHAHDLEKNMRRNSLEHKLQNRPQLESLIEKGIVEKTEQSA